MFMKHYAPNRCGPGGGGRERRTKGGQGGCEQRIEVFVKIQKKKIGGSGGGVRLGWGGGGQGGYD